MTAFGYYKGIPVRGFIIEVDDIVFPIEIYRLKDRTNGYEAIVTERKEGSPETSLVPETRCLALFIRSGGVKAELIYINQTKCNISGITGHVLLKIVDKINMALGITECCVIDTLTIKINDIEIPAALLYILADGISMYMQHGYEYDPIVYGKLRTLALYRTRDVETYFVEDDIIDALGHKSCISDGFKLLRDKWYANDMTVISVMTKLAPRMIHITTYLGLDQKLTKNYKRPDFIQVPDAGSELDIALVAMFIGTSVEELQECVNIYESSLE